MSCWLRGLLVCVCTCMICTYMCMHVPFHAGAVVSSVHCCIRESESGDALEAAGWMEARQDCSSSWASVGQLQCTHA